MKRSEAINSSAYRMLNFLIEDKVRKLKSWLDTIKHNQGMLNSSLLNVGTSFDEVKTVELPLDLFELKVLESHLQEVSRLHKEIEDLNRQKLYLIQADHDWNDGGERSRKVFGVKSYE